MNEVRIFKCYCTRSGLWYSFRCKYIYVNGVNHGLLDPYVFLDQVDVKRVNYIHIAGHDEEHSAAQVVEDLEGESFNKIKGGISLFTRVY